MNVSPVSEQSINFLTDLLSPSDRILVTGAGGWFGKTIAALLSQSNALQRYVTRNPRTIAWGTGSIEATGWNWKDICDFAPTIVIDCAFILRDFIGDMSHEKYIAENYQLTSNLLQAASLDSVQSVIYVSSGASICPVDSLVSGVEQNPYGQLKRNAELALMSLGSELNKNTLVVRPFSLSGTLVTRPERYAFSDLIRQARKGEIHISASNQVWRKYVSVEDFFAVSIVTSKSKSGYLNSGGQLVELSELAQMISDTIGGVIPIHRNFGQSNAGDRYFSSDSSWEEACESLNYFPMDLQSQINSVDEFLQRNGHY